MFCKVVRIRFIFNKSDHISSFTFRNFNSVDTANIIASLAKTSLQLSITKSNKTKDIKPAFNAS